MPGIYDGVRREGEQLLLYGVYKLGIVAILKVGASDRTLEQGVTGEKYTAVGRIEAHTAS